jgi:Domain of unknown function (DUF4347)
MMFKSEILFVDPSVSDIATILGGLRPEVEAIVLDSSRPAARQIAESLRGRRGLDAVHVIAHGAPGRVRFAAGGWSAETLGDAADDLVTVGYALRPHGRLMLWSCNAGEGTRGHGLVDALSRVIGVPVGAATRPVGAAALGGEWELEGLSFRGSSVRPPLTDTGIGQYAGICAAGLTGATGVLEDNYVKVVWIETSSVGTYFIVVNDRGTRKVIGEFEIPPGGTKGRVFIQVNTKGSFIVAGTSGALNAEGSIGLFTRRSPTADLVYDAATTSILGAAGTRISCVSGRSQVGGA